VKGFEAKEREKQTVEVLRYESDDRFIVRLRLKNKGDELLLAKGYDTRYPKEMLEALGGSMNQPVTSLGEYNDQTEAVFNQHLAWGQYAHLGLRIASWWGPGLETNFVAGIAGGNAYPCFG
jgi:hypothetical protein